MVLHDKIPFDTGLAARLPGTRPLEIRDWWHVDEAFAGQMALRDELIATRPQDVIATTDAADPAIDELAEFVIAHLPTGYAREGDQVIRPDGVSVSLKKEAALATLGRLLPLDLCLIEKPEGAREHILSAAVLCFPASWTLAEKIGRPLIRIHKPVPAYDSALAMRVQRLFDGVQVGRPLWRCNALHYADPALFHPRTEIDPRKRLDHGGGHYFRSEKQCLIRLPKTQAVVFSIQTFVVKSDAEHTV